MDKLQKFYVCKRCGNLIGMIQDSGVIPVCCKEAMEELVPNKVDASVEKHIPVVSVAGNCVEVMVGSTEHPMTEEHYIQWIYIQTKNGGQRRRLSFGDSPKAVFELKEDEFLTAFAYCNLHGLWMK